MQALALETLVDDDCILAINKPAGLPTQAPRQFDSVERRVRAWLSERPAAQRSETTDVDDRRPAYLGLPHRLDRPASGVLLLAKTPRAARLLSRQFERRQIEKIYWACVCGKVEPPEGSWQDYVRKLPGVPKVEIVTADESGAVEAALQYHSIGETPQGSCLEIKLQTGRTHQIRVQAAARGHPIVGDSLYGSTVPFGPQFTDERQRGLALHARSITFRHPTSLQSCTITAAPPETWRPYVGCLYNAGT
jgi:23S rRNA pseudouridine1911/1915/1917 synthase